MIPFLAWPAAALVGVSLGLLGSGGSILTVPLLHSVVGLPMPASVATSFPIVGLVAFAGLVAHARARAVRLSAAMPFVLASVPAAFAAKRLLDPLIPTDWKTWAFAALMFVAAWRMAFGKTPASGSDPAANPKRHPVAVLAWGAVVGALTGLLGVGGGFLIVPALVLLLDFEMRHAIGTSLAVIALNCAASSLANAVGPDDPVDVPLAALFTVVGSAGVLVGGLVSRRLSPTALRRVFACVVIAMAVVLLTDPLGRR